MNVERILWPLHAQRRLQERGLDVAEVEDVIRAPGQVVADRAHAGRWIAQRRLDGTLLRVIYADLGGGDVVVIRVYRATQVARYWRTQE